MLKLNHCSDIENLHPPFLAINLSNRKPGTRAINDKLFNRNQTGHWPLTKAVLSIRVERQTVVLFYSDKGTSNVYIGTCLSKRKSGLTKKGEPRYTLTMTRRWKERGNTNVTFTKFLAGCRMSSNPTVVWVDSMGHDAPQGPGELPRIPLDDVQADLERAIRKSGQLSSRARAKRLAKAPKIPSRIAVTTYVFRRNADVIVETLARANGHCERCTLEAPFLRRTDGSPYLEVHHRIPLAAGGEDTVANAIALCPNCHRRAHFGETARDSGTS